MEEDSFDEDKLDEDLEAMLYSQVHYGLNNTVSQEMAVTECSLNSTPADDIQHIFTVTSRKTDHSNDLVRNATAAEMQQPLLKNVSFDNEKSQLELEVSKGKTESVFVDNIIQGDTSVVRMTPDVIHIKSSKIDDESHLKHLVKSKFDIEAELGMCASSKTIKKCSKTESDKCTPLKTSKSSMPAFLGTTISTSEFIKIDQHSSQTEKDYRKTLNRLLSSKSISKKGKDIVVIKSDSGSSSSSSSSSVSGNESGDSDSSCVSNSESDIDFLGSTLSDKTVKSATVPTLDLNWNVTSADRETIDRIEKRASQVDESKWKINDEDMVPVTSSKMSRYYTKNRTRCRNCDREGHLSRDCPVPKKKPSCGLCGTEGHTMNRCTGRLCFNCSQPGHKGSDCRQPKRDRFAKCARCLFKGHSEDQCPDLWRQYHLTITKNEDLIPRRREVNSRIFCSNCAKQGHFAHECRRERMDRFNLPSSPFVIKYDVPLAKGKKGLSGTSTTDRHSGHKDKMKKFKSSYRHSRSRSSIQSKEPCSQRYFSAQSSTLSAPHQHTPSSGSDKHRPLEKDGQKVLATGQRGSARGRPHLSGHTKQLIQSFLDDDSRKIHYQSGRPDRDKNFDWHRERDSYQQARMGRKRPSSPAWKKDKGNIGQPPPSKKKKAQRTQEHWKKKSDISQEAQMGIRRKPHKLKQQGKPPPHWDNSINRKSHEHRDKQAKQRWETAVAQSSSSIRGKETLTITCKNGFRTTVKTLNFNRHSRNAQY